MRTCLLSILCLPALAVHASDALPAASAATPAGAQALAAAIVASHGGPDKLLRTFTFSETFLLAGREKGVNRTSILQPPRLWFVGKRERVSQENKGHVCHDVWMWTLAPLLDPASTLALLPEKEIDGRKAVGLRVSGTMNPPMDSYFAADTHDLLKIEWRGEHFHFSAPIAVDGTRVPSKCILIGKNGKERMRTELREVKRLAALPADLPVPPPQP